MRVLIACASRTGSPRSGDWRDWSRIDRWASEIAGHLDQTLVAPRVPGPLPPSPRDRR
jgi:hypothetical protein